MGDLVFSKRNITLCLVGIASISIIIKLCFTDFSLPFVEDGRLYVLQAITHTNGQFEVLANRNWGWSLLLSIFYLPIDSNDFIFYSNVTRIISILVSTSAILPMYLLGRKFFNEKYSLVAACLLAFEPHLIWWSVIAYAESLYIPVVILTLYFIMNKNNKLIYLSFVFAGLAWWVRFEGLIMIFIVSVIFFLLNRRSKKVFLKYLICFGIFAIVISPLLIQRDNQFGDPLYMDYSERIFIDDYYEKGMAEDDATALNYIEIEGIEKFISRFVIDGSLNVVEQTIRLSAPYLLVLVPFGLVLSFRVFHQDSSYVKANWIMLILYGAFMVPVLATLIDRRFLFALLPPLIIFAVIPIQRLVEYGLSTFSFSPKNRNIFFVVILCIILLSTVLFMDRFERKDLSKANEDLAFANVLFSDLDSGHIFDPSKRTFEHGYLYYLKLSNPPGNFKNFQITDDTILGPTSEKRVITMYGESLNEIITNAKNEDVRYLLVDEDNNDNVLDELYSEKNSYSFLTKVYDTQEHGMKILKIKVFEINFEHLTP